MYERISVYVKQGLRVPVELTLAPLPVWLKVSELLSLLS